MNRKRVTLAVAALVVALLVSACTITVRPGAEISI